MTVRVYRPQLLWCPPKTGEIFIEPLALELELWKGTPYESGQSFRGRGADCIGSVFGIIDALDGKDRKGRPALPHDTAMHNRASAIGALRDLIRRYQPIRRLTTFKGQPTEVEAGDLLVTGQPGGGPGHVMIVGTRPNELWHALPQAGFHQTGWGLLKQQILYAVYRNEDKFRWVR